MTGLGKPKRISRVFLRAAALWMFLGLAVLLWLAAGAFAQDKPVAPRAQEPSAVHPGRLNPSPEANFPGQLCAGGEA
jgi:hypothetical protein